VALPVHGAATRKSLTSIGQIETGSTSQDLVKEELAC
jgi:hypothetical protein